MLNIKTGTLSKLKTGMLVVFVCEDSPVFKDPAAAGLVSQARAYPEFKGRDGDELMFYSPDGVKAERVLLFGLGKKDTVDAEAFRAAAGKAAGRAIKADVSEILFCAHEKKDHVVAMMEGAVLGNHLFDLYKQEKKKKALKEISFHTGKSGAGNWPAAAGRVETICRGTIMAREWVSTPPNDKRPDMFARSIVKAAGKEKLNIVDLDDKNIRKNRMHALLAVGSGSDAKPRMVILDYHPEKFDKTVVLVGKGVTFDSGGINLKPSTGIADMKQDMAGAAAVAAALITASRIGVGHRVIGVVPIVENMPSGRAYRPGDIVKTASGKSVEIGNTDAEGRMILADAITYAASQYKPDILIDIATLTGACKMALGPKIAGVFSLDAGLTASIVASGKTTHERCWSMPMPDDYSEMIKSNIADIRNAGRDSWGGAISAALFLSEFAKDVKWAHIDIAGPAFADKANSYCPAGGTGFGVRLFIDLLEKL